MLVALKGNRRLSHVSRSKQDKWQKWRKDVLRHKKDVIFVAMDALVKIYAEDLIATRSVTVM